MIFATNEYALDFSTRRVTVIHRIHPEPEITRGIYAAEAPCEDKVHGDIGKKVKAMNMGRSLHASKAQCSSIHLSVWM